MSATITTANKRLIKELLKIGRWNNESEIIRFGLHLVAREVEEQQRQGLSPYPPSLLAKVYRQMTVKEHEEDRSMARACAFPKKGELE
jgi:Arc/MetJ-type ribon-helix-helix transcriptional regulator